MTSNASDVNVVNETNDDDNAACSSTTIKTEPGEPKVLMKKIFLNIKPDADNWEIDNLWNRVSEMVGFFNEPMATGTAQTGDLRRVVCSPNLLLSKSSQNAATTLKLDEKTIILSKNDSYAYGFKEQIEPRVSPPSPTSTTEANVAIKKEERDCTTATNSPPYKCNICTKTFAVPARLTRHYRTHTGERPYQCEFCDKKFGVKENLSVHRRIHTKERPYKCDVCARAFEHSGKLHRHMRIHTGERPHACAVCHKTFIQSGQLVIHMRTHTGEKPYVCTTCNKGFTCSKQLKVHTRSHSGEKPYACEICGKSFGYNHVLKVHLVAHYSQKVYKCTLCQATFTSKKNLEAHIKTHSDGGGNHESKEETSSVTYSSNTPPLSPDEQAGQHVYSMEQESKVARYTSSPPTYSVSGNGNSNGNNTNTNRQVTVQKVHNYGSYSNIPQKSSQRPETIHYEPITNVTTSKPIKIYVQTPTSQQIGSQTPTQTHTIYTVTAQKTHNPQQQQPPKMTETKQVKYETHSPNYDSNYQETNYYYVPVSHQSNSQPTQTRYYTTADFGLMREKTDSNQSQIMNDSMVMSEEIIDDDDVLSTSSSNGHRLNSPKMEAMETSERREYYHVKTPETDEYSLYNFNQQIVNVNNGNRHTPSPAMSDSRSPSTSPAASPTMSPSMSPRCDEVNVKQQIRLPPRKRTKDILKSMEIEIIDNNASTLVNNGNNSNNVRYSSVIHYAGSM